MKRKLLLTLLAVIAILMTGCISQGSTYEEVYMANIALVIVDIQNDYFEGGAYTLYNPLVALANSEDILKSFRRHNDSTIIHIQHNNSPGVGFMEAGTWGALIHENLTPQQNEVVITKREISSFAGTNLEEVLREANITTIVITGMQTNVCVEATARDALALGFNVIILEDACAALDFETHSQTIGRLRNENITIMPTSAYIRI